MEWYREEILELARYPRNFGVLKDGVRSGVVRNRGCGDWVEVFAKFDGDRVIEFRWRGGGCALCMAGASLMSEEIMNARSRVRLGALSGEELVGKWGFGGVTVVRMKCLLLGWEGWLRVS